MITLTTLAVLTLLVYAVVRWWLARRNRRAVRREIFRERNRLPMAATEKELGELDTLNAMFYDQDEEIKDD